MSESSDGIARSIDRGLNVLPAQSFRACPEKQRNAELRRSRRQRFMGLRRVCRVEGDQAEAGPNEHDELIDGVGPGATTIGHGIRIS